MHITLEAVDNGARLMALGSVLISITTLAYVLFRIPAEKRRGDKEAN